MVLLGLSCLWPSLGASRKGDSFDALPDCILEKILHELPWDQVLRCRAVCRRWRHLIDDRNFAALAKPGKLQPSVKVFQCVRPYATGMEGGDEFGLYLIRPRPNKPLTKGGIKRMPLSRVKVPDEILMHDANPPVIRGTCDGFIVFGGLYGQKGYFICNPVTQESVKLGEKIAESVCGFYFSHSREEYRLLCAGRRANNQFGYYTCDLRGESRNELRLNPHGPGKGQGPAPVIVGGFLYSLMHCNGYYPTIMSLDLDTEELQFRDPPWVGTSFRFLPFRVPPRGGTYGQYLLEAEGRLCFFGFSWGYREWTLEIWSLQHHATWSWDKMFRH